MLHEPLLEGQIKPGAELGPLWSMQMGVDEPGKEHAVLAQVMGDRPITVAHRGDHPVVIDIDDHVLQHL